MDEEQLNSEPIEDVNYEELNGEIIEDISDTPYEELMVETMEEGGDDYECDHDMYDGEPPVVIQIKGELTITDDQTCEFEPAPECLSELPNVQYAVVEFTVKGTDHVYREINNYCKENDIDQAMFDALCYEKEDNIEDYFLSINGGEFVRTDFKS